jgi:hemoglobin-like flavoprotein
MHSSSRMDAALLKSSFGRILEREHALAARFYEKLFRLHPELLRHFVGARAHQEQMLARALVAMVDRIDDAPWIEEQLSQLGQRHVRYGITPEMYRPFGEALLATLAEVGGADWTPAVAAAWSEAFIEITRLMLKGASGPSATVVG